MTSPDPARLTALAKAWAEQDPDPVTVKEADALIAAKDWAQLSERYEGALEFGTAGLRGTLGAGPNRMNRAVVRRTTLGLARYLSKLVPDAKKRGVVVGRDGRTMSLEFATDVAEVLAAEGFTVHAFTDVGPTPLTAYALLHLNACAAVMVTASHNPPEYNGYKVYWGNGAQIVPPHDHGIATSIEQVGPANKIPLMSTADARAKGLIKPLGAEIEKAYLAAIETLVPNGAAPNRSALKIVYTAMHGVGAKLALQTLRNAGFEVHPVAAQEQPDARFPTVRFPNPEEKGALDLSAALAEQTKADLVLANDPDADRLAAMARTTAGAMTALTGNQLGVLLGEYALTSAQVKKPLVITTMVSSGQLKQIAQQLGASYAETLTGFKWIANRALELGAEGFDFLFGYEEALGYTHGTVVRDKDGISAARVCAELAARCKQEGTTLWGRLEQLQRKYGLFASSQRNFTLPGQAGAAQIAALMNSLRSDPPKQIGTLTVETTLDYQGQTRTHHGKVETLPLPPSNTMAFELSDQSKVTVRPSGTEPKVKIYFELPEPVAAQEPMEKAQARAKVRLDALESAMVAVAHLRGLPQ